MEKLKMHTPDLTGENVEKIAALFPNCVTEATDENGKLTRAIDFDQLRQELSGTIVEGPRERYHLDWPGKREATMVWMPHALAALGFNPRAPRGTPSCNCVLLWHNCKV